MTWFLLRNKSRVCGFVGRQLSCLRWYNLFPASCTDLGLHLQGLSILQGTRGAMHSYIKVSNSSLPLEVFERRTIFIPFFSAATSCDCSIIGYTHIRLRNPLKTSIFSLRHSRVTTSFTHDGNISVFWTKRLTEIFWLSSTQIHRTSYTPPGCIGNYVWNFTQQISIQSCFSVPAAELHNLYKQ